jgi:hypothetical protein
VLDSLVVKSRGRALVLQRKDVVVFGITGIVVIAASSPGRCGAVPPIATITRTPRAVAASTHRRSSSGCR